jgi:hypothetical protein
MIFAEYISLITTGVLTFSVPLSIDKRFYGSPEDQFPKAGFINKVEHSSTTALSRMPLRDS